MKIRRRKEPGPTVPTSSMGDIAFLLTIFFMVCSVFIRESGIEFEKPAAPEVANLDPSQVSVIIDRDGKVFLNGNELGSADGLSGLLEGLLAKATKPSERVVLFQCDKGIDRAVFEPVLDEIVRSGAVIAAVGEKEAVQRANK